MPVTITYDLRRASTNNTNWLRSMLERFGFRRLGGTVFRYQGAADADGGSTEDWLNHVAPALMLFRSYVAHHNLTLTRFTVDAHSVAFMDLSDPAFPVGAGVQAGAAIALSTPTNPQSGEATVRDFIDACADVSP
jgi:hypothetical protein